MIDEHGRVRDPETTCWSHGMHYHCTICWEVTGMPGHSIYGSDFGDMKYSCQEGKTSD